MAQPTDSPPTRVVELVVNLDDATGELIASAIDALMQHGALDCWATPITMKKGRPATMLSALAEPEDRDTLAQAMLEQTGSFGVRCREWDRVVLDRDWHDRPTRLGTITLKAGSLNGRPITVKPEHDSVAKLANGHGVSYARAQRTAQAAADALLDELRNQAGGAS